MSETKIKRRSFLKMVGAALAAIPALKATGTPKSASSKLPAHCAGKPNDLLDELFLEISEQNKLGIIPDRVICNTKGLDLIASAKSTVKHYLGISFRYVSDSNAVKRKGLYFYGLRVEVMYDTLNHKPWACVRPSNPSDIRKLFVYGKYKRGVE